MSDNIKELVDRLRLATVVETFIGPDGQGDHTTELGMDAADALEAMAGEVDTAKSQFKALQMVTSKEHEDTKAERDRLAGEVERVSALLRASRADEAELIRERDRLKAALEKFLAEADNAPKRIIGSGIGGQTMEATLQRAGRLVSEWQLGQLEEALGGDAS